MGVLLLQEALIIFLSFYGNPVTQIARADSKYLRWTSNKFIKNRTVVVSMYIDLRILGLVNNASQDIVCTELFRHVLSWFESETIRFILQSSV